MFVPHPGGKEPHPKLSPWALALWRGDYSKMLPLLEGVQVRYRYTTSL